MPDRLRLALSGTRAMVYASVAMFVVITVVRLLVTSPGWGITLLYDVPVALLAVAFGLRAGLLAAAAGLALFALIDLTRPIVVNGVAVHQNAAGYTSRALVFFVLGGLLGLYADRLRATEGLLGRVLDATHDPIITADPEGHVVGFNRAAEAAFGTSAPDALGRPMDSFVAQGVGHRADGTSFPAEVAASSFEHHGGAFTTAVISDVTERLRIERMRAEHQANLERSNAELEQFAYVASHDLQEPLRSIGGFAGLLERRYGGRLDDEADRFIGFITGGVERMQSLIDGLLAYSSANREELSRQTVALDAVVDGAVAAVEAARVDAGGEIVVAPDLPTVSADPTALTRVVQNLLGNALKFSNGAAPRVEVAADRSDEGWVLSVSDNGIGIEPQYAERVFRMFQRLHGRDEYSGTGIGLAVSRTMVERQGGRIWCEPAPSGRGTTFRVLIPDGPT